MSEKILSYVIEARDEAAPAFESAGEAMREALVEGPRLAQEALAALDESLAASAERMAEHGAALSGLGEGIVQGIESSSAAMLESVLGGAESAGDALKGFLQQSLAMLANLLSQQAAQFLLHSILKGKAKQKEAASTSAANVGQVFTGQFAAMSQAPFPINLTAPAVASTMMAAAQAGLAAASAAGAALGAASVPVGMAQGGFVPMLPGAQEGRDSVLTALTPGELVIPEPFARQFGEGGAGGGGTVNVAVFPAEPSLLGPMLEAISEAVERYGFQLVASRVAA